MVSPEKSKKKKKNLRRAQKNLQRKMSLQMLLLLALTALAAARFERSRPNMARVAFELLDKTRDGVLSAE